MGWNHQLVYIFVVQFFHTTNIQNDHFLLHKEFTKMFVVNVISLKMFSLSFVLSVKNVFGMLNCT